jgi:hypothetical protein
MKRIVLLAVVCAAAVVGAAVGGGIASSEPAGDGALQRQLAEVRRATVRFHDVAAAEAAGYINPGAGHCTELPGAGGMGVHFVNPALIFDGGVVEATQPEVLLYAPDDDGDLRLVAVEYLVPTADWDGTETPDLFGVPFDGPMPEHEPGTTGDHYDQHAWIWSHNPDGPLAVWNSDLVCP